jgi:hypothetical protein
MEGTEEGKKGGREEGKKLTFPGPPMCIVPGYRAELFNAWSIL